MAKKPTTQSTAVAVQNQAPAITPVNMMAMIAQAAADPRTDVAKMQAMLDMHRTLQQDQQKAEYAAAMSACQAEMQRVVQAHQNSDNKSKFAKLPDIDRVARPIYTKHGFSLTFSSTETPEGFITMTCEVMHKAGFSKLHTKSGWRDDVGAKGGATKTRIQGSGSTGTYLRRYLTCDAFNIITGEMITEDNDGQRPKDAEVKKISESQAQMLIAELGGSGSPRIEKFVEHYELNVVQDLPAAMFDEVMATTRAATKKIAERAAAPAQGAQQQHHA